MPYDLLDLLDRPGWLQRQLAARFDGEVAGGAVANSFFVISSSRRGDGGRQIDPLGPRCGSRPPSPISF